jgi:transcriptional regulator with XRE-family HTH domain
MKESITSMEYRVVLETLLAMRTKAGMTQRDLAKALGREHSFVWRIETGRRRLDVVEFFWLCQTLKMDATSIYRDIIRKIKQAGHENR